MVSVITDIDTPRLRYVLGFLSEFYSEDFVLNAGADQYLSYGATDERARVRIEAAGLLSEYTIQAFDPEVKAHPAGFPVLFANDSPLGFDLFSAIFYLLSRYEEYVRPERDEYGRFAHTASIAFRHKFLWRPLIHEWLAHFSQLLFEAQRVPPFSFQPTYDIDMAWCYLHKGFARNAGGLLRSLLERDGKAVDRVAVLSKRKKDPFDCYNVLEELHQRCGLTPIYFIHAGTHRNRYDKNIPLTHPAMAALVRRLSQNAQIGIHPSWASGDDPNLLAMEKSLLEQTLGAPVSVSRQHYIRLSMPETYRQLITAGITDDYSMGYGSVNGFRASVSVPFYWYDLAKEEETGLRLHPFCFMDATLLYEQLGTDDDLESDLYHYDSALYEFGGVFIPIFHNTILGSAPEFAGWADTYRHFVETVTSGG